MLSVFCLFGTEMSSGPQATSRTIGLLSSKPVYAPGIGILPPSGELHCGSLSYGLLLYCFSLRFLHLKNMTTAIATTMVTPPTAMPIIAPIVRPDFGFSNATPSPGLALIVIASVLKTEPLNPIRAF